MRTLGVIVIFFFCVLFIVTDVNTRYYRDLKPYL